MKQAIKVLGQKSTLQVPAMTTAAVASRETVIAETQYNQLLARFVDVSTTRFQAPWQQSCRW